MSIASVLPEDSRYMNSGVDINIAVRNSKSISRELFHPSKKEPLSLADGTSTMKSAWHQVATGPSKDRVKLWAPVIFSVGGLST